MKRWSKKLEGKLVKIIWDDIQDMTGWNDLAEARKHTVTECWTVGTILSIKRKYLLLCSSENDAGEAGFVQAIPKGCITDIIFLKC